MFGRQLGSVWGLGTRARNVAIGGALAAAIGYGCAPSASMAHGRRDFNLISRADLLATHYNNAYDAVEALHSNWLITRPSSELPGDQVRVYLDNVDLGGVSELSNMPVMPIKYIRYFDAVEATTLWGVGHTQGVIYISTHRLNSGLDPSM